MTSLPDSILLAGILGGLLITVLGALAMLSIGLGRRLRREIVGHQETVEQLRSANMQLRLQLDEIHQLQERLKEQAIRDPLTGLHNRRYLDETLPRELARAKREGYPLSIIMVDLDRFKQVNDTYGHPAGDEVIKALSAILKTGTREGDVACRYGGEEFVVALPRMDLEGARARGDEWRAAIAGSSIRHGELTLNVTLSAGVAAFPDHGHEIDTLVQCADLALYLSKHDGRNRVTCYQPQT
jgi:diguanylate cyclase (GGDEF)-like protein